MKYQTKLYLSFSVFVFLTTCLGLFLVFEKEKALVYEGLRSKAMTVAASGSVQLELVSHSWEQSLQELLEANQRPGVQVKGAFLISSESSSRWGVKGQEISEQKVYQEALQAGWRKHLHVVWAPKKWVRISEGVFVSAYAPVQTDKTLVVYLSAQPAIERVHWLQGFTLGVLGVVLGLGMALSWILSRKITSSLEEISRGIKEIGEGDLTVRLGVETQDEFGQLARSIEEMATQLQEHEKIKTHFASYLSPEIVHRLVQPDSQGLKSAKKKRVTVLIADIRKFTQIAETLPAEEVVSLLNEYLSKMVEQIVLHHGWVSKFVGDAIWAIFGGLEHSASQEWDALQAALAMQNALERLNQSWKEVKGISLAVGIGIHSGEVIVGPIGPSEKKEYTAFGEPLNFSILVEELTKVYEESLLFTGETQKALPPSFPVRLVKEIELSGEEGFVSLYTVGEHS